MVLAVEFDFVDDLLRHEGLVEGSTAAVQISFRF